MIRKFINLEREVPSISDFVADKLMNVIYEKP